MKTVIARTPHLKWGTKLFGLEFLDYTRNPEPLGRELGAERFIEGLTAETQSLQ